MKWVMIPISLISHVVFGWEAASIKVLSAGGEHTCSAMENGSLFCWGANYFGQLGLGDDLPRLTPTKIAESGCQFVSSSPRHTCMVFEFDNVKCVGNNEDGQLGLGTMSPSIGDTIPLTKIPYLDLGKGLKVARVVSGNRHTCALFDSGKIKCWGANNFGQLGLGDALSRGKSPSEMGVALPYVNLGDNRSAMDLCLGANHTCALLTDRNLLCWGAGTSTGLGTTSPTGLTPATMGNALKEVELGKGFQKNVRSLICAGEATCALNNLGEIKCWGKSTSGVLGNTYTGNTVGSKPEEMGDNLKEVSLAPGLRAQDLSCNSFHCCAWFENRAMKCWGSNSSGQLGLGDRKGRGTQFEDMGENLPYLKFSTDFLVQLLSLGGIHSCAVTPKKELFCWGANYFGQYGTGNYVGFGSKPDDLKRLTPTKFEG